MLETETRLFSYFYELLSRRDYSELELLSKAESKGFDCELIKQTIESLKTKNYVNEKRLVTNLIDYYGKSKGRKWLVHKLQSRLVSPDLIDQVLNQYQENISTDLKQKVALKYKITNWNKIEPSLKQKILSFLARQGYSSPYEILQTWQNEGLD